MKNEIAIITGAAGLLGPKHAEALAEIDFDLVLIDINKIQLNNVEKNLKSKFKDINIISFICDITNEKNLSKISKKLSKLKSKVSVLINNAAIDPKMLDLSNNKENSMIENYSIKTLKDEINVNLIGSFVCCKVFGQLMKKNNKGSIINIASDLSINAPDQSVYSKDEKIEKVKNFKPIGYSLSKFGIIGLTKYISTYWAHKGIRCNALALGAVNKNQPPFLKKNIIKRVPLKRLAKEDEYKKAICFLSSDDSSYMTGSTLIIDGGRSTW